VSLTLSYWALGLQNKRSDNRVYPFILDYQ
jgi:hypothetical protein